MIRLEMKRALYCKSFIATCIVNFIMLLIGGCDYIFATLSGYASPGTYLEKYLVSFGYGMTSLLAILFPIAAILPYALSYRKERDSGFYSLLILKGKRTTYRKAKVVAVACSGFVAFVLPNLVWYLVCFFLLGTGSTKYPIIYGVGFAEEIYTAYPFWYGLIYVVNAGVQGAVFSVLGLGLSAVIHNKYLAALLPFCYCIFSTAVLDAYCRGLNALSLMVIGQYCNSVLGYWGIVIYDVILMILGCGLFVVGDKYDSKA